MNGRYVLGKKLAVGGMAEIFQARVRGVGGFEKDVVVKRVLPAFAADAGFRARFFQEARLAALLTHPHIVQVYELVEQDGHTLLAMEAVHGADVATLLRSVRDHEQALPLSCALWIASCVADALAYAHERQGPDGAPLGIVHRDVTPSNVLVDIQGHVKLADFGVARIASEKTSVGDNTVKGKFAYLPPESFDRTPASAVTDVYSVAVTLHEVLTGGNEFASDAMAETVGRVLNHVPTRLDKLRADVPKALADVIAKGLAKNPAERYPTAAAFSKALSEALPQSEAAIAERLKEQVAIDFVDAKLAEMAQMPSLTELESAWRTPAPEAAPRVTNRQRAATPLPSNEATVALPAGPSSGITATARPASKKPWILIAVILGVAALGAIAFVAISAFLATKDRDATDQPAFVVVDKRGDDAAAPAVAVDAMPAVAEDAGAITPPPPPSDAAAAKKPDPVVDRPPPEPDSRQLTRAFGKYTGAVTACFKQHVEAADLDVSIRFQIDQSGKVMSATVLPESLSDKPVGRCLERIARGAQFGRQAKPVTFRVPIQAKPQ